MLRERFIKKIISEIDTCKKSMSKVVTDYYNMTDNEKIQYIDNIVSLIRERLCLALDIKYLTFEEYNEENIKLSVYRETLVAFLEG